VTRRPSRTPMAKAMRAERRTGRELAAELGVHYSQVSRWQQGHSIPEAPTQKRIAKFLNTTPEKLWPVKDKAA